MNIEAAKLLARVEEAFASSQRPQRDELPYSDYFEAVEVATALGAYKWQHVPFDIIWYHRGDLAWLTPKGIAYYLPAYMSIVLKRFDDTDTMPHALASMFVPNRRTPLKAANVLKTLTRKQVDILVEVLCWIPSQDESLTAEVKEAVENIQATVRDA